MGKTRIVVDCIDQRLIVANDPLLASGGQNEDEIEFNFCPLWDGFDKTAVFYRTPDDVYHVAVSNNRSVIPAEVLTEKGEFYFGVFGSKGEAIRTSEVIKYSIVQGAMIPGSKPAEPTPDIYAQIMSAVGDIERKVQDALPKSGGDVTGWLDFGNATRGLAWRLNDGTRVELRPYVPNSIFQLVFTPPGEPAFGAMTFYHDGTPNFTKALPISSGGTGAEDAETARANLGLVGKYQVIDAEKINIPENTDLDTLTTIGNYGVDFSNVAVTMLNKPVDLEKAFRMVVGICSNGTDMYQEIIEYTHGYRWYRYKFEGGDWSSWEKNYGAADETEMKARRFHLANGKIVQSRNGTTEGAGRATINIHPNGVVRVDFVASICTAGTDGDAYDVGLTVAKLRELNPDIPAFTPLSGGTLTYYSPEGYVNTSLQGYGGTFTADVGGWNMGRIYTETGSYGSWSDPRFAVGSHLVGTCYGYLV